MIPARHGDSIRLISACRCVYGCVRALLVSIGIPLLTMRDVLGVCAVHAQIDVIFSPMSLTATASISGFTTNTTGADAVCG